jgi:hypothetical protein
VSIPDELQNRLKDRYERVRRLDVDVNPIEKVGLIVYSVGGQLMIDSAAVPSSLPGMPTPGNVGGSAADAGFGVGTGTIVVEPLQGTIGAPNMQAMLAQNNVIRTQNAEILESMRAQFEVLRAELLTLRRTVSRFANRPAATVTSIYSPTRIQHPVVDNALRNLNNNNDDNDLEETTTTAMVPTTIRNRFIQFEATLSACPRDLYQLWDEYEFGLQGRKAAKKFTNRERGLVKYKTVISIFIC